MRWLHLLLLLLLASCCFAQDGVSPDTAFAFITGRYLSGQHDTWSSYPDSASCAFYGDSSHSACGVLNNYDTKYLASDAFIEATSAYYPTPSKYEMDRGIALFHVPFHTMKKVDSVDLRLKLLSIYMVDNDSVFVFSPPIKCSNSCDTVEACYNDSCNFYRCGGAGPSWPEDYLDFYDGVATGWVQFDILGECCAPNDTVAYGFATRRFPDGSAPTGVNTFMTVDNLPVDTAAMLIYHYSLRYNDISHQDNADGISPDTLNFICSQALDEIRTPGQWRNEYLPTWLNADPTVFDCYQGQFGDAGDCDDEASQPDSSRCGNYWNYAMQPNVRASKRSAPYSDFHQIRAYIFGEVEKPIPTKNELDSIKIYLRTGADFDDADGDSLFMVSYTPYHQTADTCYVCYSCYYTPIVGWGGCNYYRCGDELVYGNVIDPSQGRPILQYQWQWHWIDTSIVDLTQSALGDTFGLGFTRKHFGSIEPTGANSTNILVDSDCPYIVYWFSERAREDEFINWGLKPPHLGWGLPVNQPRRAWGGGRKP